MSTTATPATSNSSSPTEDTPKPKRSFDFNQVLVEGRALIALALIIVVFSLMSDRYLTPDNLILMAKHVAMNAILALGMLVVILNGGIDLSVGSTVGLSGIVAGYLLQGMQIPFSDMFAYPAAWVVMVLALMVGALVGWINGILVSRFKVAPFIATLGMLYVARGVAQLISNGETFTRIFGEDGLGNTGFVSFLAGSQLGIPMPIWIMVVFAILFSILLTRTPFGRWLYATGGNERAAELSGVPIKKVQVRIYVISGICAAMVGLLLTADLPGATPQAGLFYELNAIAAVVIGGAALSGGRGTVRGTIIGAFVIGFLVDGLVIVGVDYFWQQVIRGAVIILAVALDQLQQRMQAAGAVRRAKAGITKTPSGSSGGQPTAAQA
ncbi:MAG: ABC transporter permease [Actinomycetales bacterium]